MITIDRLKVWKRSYRYVRMIIRNRTGKIRLNRQACIKKGISKSYLIWCINHSLPVNWVKCRNRQRKILVEVLSNTNKISPNLGQQPIKHEIWKNKLWDRCQINQKINIKTLILIILFLQLQNQRLQNIPEVTARKVRIPREIKNCLTKDNQTDRI